jgi:hypothetical protein
MEHPDGQTLWQKVWQPMCGHLNTHWFDPYSFVHLQFGILTALLGIPFTIVNIISIVWEIIESSPPMVRVFHYNEKYQEYFGDSLVNSAGDHMAVLAGFALAMIIPFKIISVAILIGLEWFNYRINGDAMIPMTSRTLRESWNVVIKRLQLVRKQLRERKAYRLAIQEELLLACSAASS